MYREWGPRAKPIWNPLKNAGKVDSIERELKGMDEFCAVCKKRGHPWRQCPKLNSRRSEPDFAAAFKKQMDDNDLRYCVRCFRRGHEEEDCPKAVTSRAVKPKVASQQEVDLAKFIQAKRNEIQTVVDDEPRKPSKFARFRKREAPPDPEPPRKRMKVAAEDPAEEEEQQTQGLQKKIIAEPSSSKKPVVSEPDINKEVFNFLQFLEVYERQSPIEAPYSWFLSAKIRNRLAHAYFGNTVTQEEKLLKGIADKDAEIQGLLKKLGAEEAKADTEEKTEEAKTETTEKTQEAKEGEEPAEEEAQPIPVDRDGVPLCRGYENFYEFILYEPLPEEKEAFLKENPQCDPYMFLAGHQKIIILGEEDFSLSLDIIKHFSKSDLESGKCKVTSTAYKPNKYPTDFESKFKELGGTTRYNCDAQEADTFEGEKYDAIVFTFPRLYESLDTGYVQGGKKEEWFTDGYMVKNRKFFSTWLQTAKDHLVPGGKIYIVLINNQFENWNLNQVCCNVGLQWCMIGEFGYFSCIHYKPKNERGQRWFPNHPMIFSIFHPIFIPPSGAPPPPQANAQEGVKSEETETKTESVKSEKVETTEQKEAIPAIIPAKRKAEEDETRPKKKPLFETMVLPPR